jgi:hypothetical protein
LENLVLNGRILLKSVLKEQEFVEYIALPQDRERWLLVVNAIMNIRGPLNARWRGGGGFSERLVWGWGWGLGWW